jgi:hypothetical protein
MDDTRGDPTSQTAHARSPSLHGRAFVLLPVLTFVAGMLLGGALVGVATDRGDPGGNGGATSPSRTASPQPSVTASADPDAIVVPGACAEAARNASQAVSLLRDAVAAIGELDAARLADILDDLEQLDRRIREDAAACRTGTRSSP